MSGIWDLPSGDITAEQMSAWLDALNKKYPRTKNFVDPISNQYFSQFNRSKLIPNVGIYKLGKVSNNKVLPDELAAYRADPTGKYGKGIHAGVESLPTYMDMNTMGDLLATYKEAREKYPDIVPEISSKQFANMALNEGRSNFGYSAGLYSPNKNDKNAVKVFNGMTDAGWGWDNAGFVSALVEKNRIAQQLNKPFDEVWNGTGVSALSHRTGAQNAERMRQGAYAVEHPLNKPLLDFIDYTLNPGESDDEYFNRAQAAKKAQEKIANSAPFLSQVQHVAHEFIDAIPDAQEFQYPDIPPRQTTPLQEAVEQWEDQYLQQFKQQTKATPLPDGYRSGGRVRMI
jgi:hypothetical protein